MNAHSPAPLRDAYAYVRVSSDRQTSGDGLRRQHQLALDWIAENGCRLVEELRDEGVSAASGANLTTGAFGKFVRRVKNHEIPPGTALVVESLDRFSREEVSSALPPLLELINHGIEVYSIADKQKFIKGSPDLVMNLMASLLVYARAYEEHAKKVFRLREVWANKRREISSNEKVFTRRVPAWLVYSPVGKGQVVDDEGLYERDGPWLIHKERRSFVQKIFEELANGVGRDKIARRLNEAGVKPWAHGKLWHGGTVQKFTDTRAALGYFQPHRLEEGKRVAEGPAVKIWPAVISEELYERTLTSIKSRQAGTQNSGGRKGVHFSNLVTGLVFCAECNLPMQYRDRGPRSTPVLRCSGERNGKCENKTRIEYKPFEEILIEWLAAGLRLDDEREGERARFDHEIAKLSVEAGLVQEEIDALIVVQMRSRTAAAKIEERERRLSEIETKTAELIEDRNAFFGKLTSEDRQSAVQEYRSKFEQCAEVAERYALRARLHQHFRSIVDRIECNADGKVYLTVLDGLKYLAFRRNGDYAHGYLKPGQWPKADFGTPRLAESTAGLRRAARTIADHNSRKLDVSDEFVNKLRDIWGATVLS